MSGLGRPILVFCTGQAQYFMMSRKVFLGPRLCVVPHLLGTPVTRGPLFGVCFVSSGVFTHWGKDTLRVLSGQVSVLPLPLTVDYPCPKGEPLDSSKTLISTTPRRDTDFW